MNWLQSIIYGLISGLSEFMPVSSFAHQNILRELFGIDGADVVQDLFVHLAALAAVLYGCNNMLEQIKRSTRNVRRNRGSSEGSLDLRFVKTAAIPMLALFVILTYVGGQNYSFPVIALLLLLNGIVIFISGRMLQGNKDARSMSKLDSYLFGIVSASSAFFGLSRVGTGISLAISRGADRQHALNWVMLLSIPSLVLMSGLDLIGLFSMSNLSAVSGNVLGYLLSACGSFLGGYASILLMKFLAVKGAYSGFAYYSWGAALFTFILYLL